MTSPYADRLHRLRQEMARQGVQGFLVPRGDEYGGENVPACAERLRWISGFTGSAGTAIILDDGAVVMSDGRYTIQLKQQVNGELFSVANSVEVSVAAWLAEQAPGKTIGFDPRLHTAADIQKLEDRNIGLKPLYLNPLDAVWDDRPAPPAAKVAIFPAELAGMAANDKIEAVAVQLREENAGAVVITLPDSIAWLLNIRGGDVAHTPVPLSNAIIRADGSVQLFIDAVKLDEDVRTHLGNRVHVAPPEMLESELIALAKTGKTVWIDEARGSYWFKMILIGAGARIANKKDPCIAPKARKNMAEQRAMKQAHIRDGAAMVTFLCWLEREAPGGKQSELSVEKKLTEIRARAPEYKETSFDTIAGFGANGAIVHYRASIETNKTITAPGMLLIDSGAQYVDGTTDITRTVTVGMPTEEQKFHYTLVLKAHIAVSRARFPAGTTGMQIDALARAPLWQENLDYAHGTGHGVGCYLSVHEEAASISTRGKDALEPGMILSNEPGYYREDYYGIRTENLVLVVEAGPCADTGKTLLAFETITLCPYDCRLIEPKMLDEGEKEWLRGYHDKVCAALWPLIGEEERAFLTRHTDENIFT